MLMRAEDRAGAGDTQGPTVTPTRIERGQRNAVGLGPFHGKISRASVMLRYGGNEQDSLTF